MADPPREQVGEHDVEVARAGLDDATRVLAQLRRRWNRPLPEHNRLRLVRQQFACVTPRGEARVVGENGAGSDQDRVDRGALPVHQLPGGNARDPRAGPVGCGRAPVEARRPLQADERAPLPNRREPDPQECFGGIRFHTRNHLDAGLPQPGRAARGVLARIADGVYDTRDSGGDQRLATGTRAAGVIARFEGDDGGGPGCRPGELALVVVPVRVAEFAQGVYLGMGRASAAMPALGDYPAAHVEDDAADSWVGPHRGSPGGELQSTTHRGAVRVALGHPVSLISRSRDGLRAFVIDIATWRRPSQRAPDGTRSCYLSSRLRDLAVS